MVERASITQLLSEKGVFMLKTEEFRFKIKELKGILSETGHSL